MRFLIDYIAEVAPIIYALCGLVALVQLYRTWRVREERRQAIFTLERERAMMELYSIFVTAVLLLALMGFTYFVTNTLAVAVDVSARSAQPSPQAVLEESPPEAVGELPLLPTPTNTPRPPTPTPASTPTRPPPQPPPQAVEPTAPEPEPPTPTPVPVAPALCPDARSVILSPGNGAVVSGPVTFVGTAQHDLFDYYKLEFVPDTAPQANWSWFDGGESPVVNGVLGTLNTTGLPNGVYTVRLVVVDRTGNYPPPCQVTITIQN